jgi:predicted amidophosphoribosyltransferase
MPPPAPSGQKSESMSRSVPANPGRLRSWLSEASDALISVFFPAGCRVCNTLLTTASRVPICRECLGSFVRLAATACEVCGRPLATIGTAPDKPLLCPACRDNTYVFQRVRSFALYEGALVKAIMLLRFEQIQPLGDWFAERLREVLDKEKEMLTPDVVVPVPLHRQREKERGYNQAALISKPLAKRLRLPHRAVLLVRTRPARTSTL